MKIFLLVSFISCTLALSPETTRHVDHLRNLPIPSAKDYNDQWSLEAAKQVHLVVMDRARKIKVAHGHVHRMSPPMQLTKTHLSSGIPNATVPTFSPVSFGADPTGKEDSTDAMLKALSTLLKCTSSNPTQMAVRIVDLGGATLDLGGGVYNISKPLVIPVQYGNFRIRGGTLRAGPNFPPEKWLIMVGAPLGSGCTPIKPDGSKDNQKSCNEYVDLSELMLDGGHIAAGGVYIAATMGSTVGPSVFVHGFVKQGIMIVGGHETMISEAWIAECYWSTQRKAHTPCFPETSTSIGIEIDGNDHVVSNVIIFIPTSIGILVKGGANLLYGVHTWNLGHQANSAGIALGNNSLWHGGAYQIRLQACYFDTSIGSGLHLFEPHGIIVEDSFFLKTYIMIHKAMDPAAIDGLIIRSNQFTDPHNSIFLNETFKGGVKNVIVADNIGANKSTYASGVLTLKNAKRWEIDLSSQLLFTDIQLGGRDRISYSVVSDSTTFFQHMARSPKNGVVIVETSAPVDATIFVEVTQTVFASS